MHLYGARRNPKIISDRLVWQSSRKPLEHILFAPGQSGDADRCVGGAGCPAFNVGKPFEPTFSK